MINVAALSREQRDELAALWQGRANSESSVRVVFDQLVVELTATGAHPDVIALARTAADDEARHAAICVELANAYRGHAIPLATAPALRLPDHGVSARTRAALHAINLCCIGETIAVAFVEACVAACADPSLRDIHRHHLADEVRHARVGWAHLASLDVADRHALAPRLQDLLRAQVSAWEARIHELPEAGIPGHGYPPRAELIAIVHGAIRDLVLPGFEHIGINASEASAWFFAHVTEARIEGHPGLR